jgi:hypothetical protein
MFPLVPTPILASGVAPELARSLGQAKSEFERGHSPTRVEPSDGEAVAPVAPSGPIAQRLPTSCSRNAPYFSLAASSFFGMCCVGHRSSLGR